jgi:hypothetical protein
MRPSAVAAVAVLATAALAVPTAGAAGHQRFFSTPAPLRASCEVDVGMPGIPSAASCLVLAKSPSKIVSVTLSASGALHVCHGLACAANPPEHVPTLAVGHSAALGPFRCSSLAGGAVRCVVARTGKGFVLRASGVQRL